MRLDFLEKITRAKILAVFILPLIVFSYLNLHTTFIRAEFDNNLLVSTEIMPPIIDGNYSSIVSEWDNKNSTKGSLDDLNIEIWIGYNETNSSLYFAISLDLENHQSKEFLGILIYNSSNSNESDFVDGKIIQNYNLGTASHQSNFVDLNFINETYSNIDSVKNGNGSCKLDGKKTKYEFEIEFNENNTDNEDAVLNISQIYAVKFIYGQNDDYSIPFSKESETLLVQIGLGEDSEITPEDFTEVVLNILTIVFFICVGSLYGYIGYYIYNSKKRRGGRR